MPSGSVLLAVKEQSLEWTKQALGAPRDVREPDEPVGQCLPGFAARQLLRADRFPMVIDHLCRFAGDLLDRQLEVLGPEAKTGLSSEGAVVRNNVHLGVVQEGVLVEVGRAEREPGVVD